MQSQWIRYAAPVALFVALWSDQVHSASTIKASKPKSFTVPIADGEGPGVYLNVEIDGVKAKLLLDTAAECRLSTTSMRNIFGLKKRKLEIIAKSVKVGQWVSRDISFIEISDENVGDEDGTIGMNMLDRIGFQLDFGKKQMTVFPGGNLSGALLPAGAAIAMKRVEESSEDAGFLAGRKIIRYHIPASVPSQEGKDISLNLLLDTGADGTILYDTQILQPMKRLGELASFPFFRSMSGDHTVRPSRLPAFRIGSMTIKQPVVFVEPPDDDHNDGLLGIDALKRFRVTLDFPANRMNLQPDPSFREDETEWSGVGLVLELKDKVFTVSSVIPQSAAAQAGVRPGDIVRAFNGVRTDGMTIERANGHVWFLRPGVEVLVEIKRAGNDQPQEFMLKARKLL